MTGKGEMTWNILVWHLELMPPMGSDVQLQVVLFLAPVRVGEIMFSVLAEAFTKPEKKASATFYQKLFLPATQVGDSYSTDLLVLHAYESELSSPFRHCLY